MSNAKLLIERVRGQFTVTESKSGGPIRIRCATMAIGDQPTENDRIYPTILLERETKRLNEKAKAGALVGGSDHPTDGRTKISETPIQWTAIYMEGKSVVGEAVILPTTAGRDLEALIRSGVPVGVSSRGMGRTTTKLVEGKKVEIVESDYELLTFDVVLSPAVEQAQLQLVESHQQKKCELTVEQRRMQQLAGVAGLSEWAEPRQDQPDGVAHSSTYDVADEKHKVSNPSNNDPEFRKRLAAAVQKQKHVTVDAIEPYAEGSWAVFDHASGKILRCSYKENEKGEIQILAITDDLPGRVRESIEHRQSTAHAVLVEETMRDPAARSLMIARAGIR